MPRWRPPTLTTTSSRTTGAAPGEVEHAPVGEGGAAGDRVDRLGLGSDRLAVGHDEVDEDVHAQCVGVRRRVLQHEAEAHCAPDVLARTEKPWSATTILGGISVPTTVTSRVTEPAPRQDTERLARPGCATSGRRQSQLATPRAVAVADLLDGAVVVADDECAASPQCRLGRDSDLHDLALQRGRGRAGERDLRRSRVSSGGEGRQGDQQGRTRRHDRD